MSRKFILLAAIVLFSLTGSAFAVEIGTTRDNPIPIGQAVNLSNGWQIKVLSVIPNANEVIRNQNEYNAPPDNGNQFFIARVEVKNTGSDVNQFNDYSLNVVGATSVAYGHGKSEVIPDEIPYTDVFPGGTIVGNAFWEVKSSDISTLVLYDKDSKPYIFFSLSPSSQTTTIADAPKHNDAVTIQERPRVLASMNNSTSANSTINNIPQSLASDSDSSSYSDSSGKTVSVSGYYRKDGTYVKPYTRSAPGSKKS